MENLGKFNSFQSKLEKTSVRFRKAFLLMFTRELIKQSKLEEFFALQNLLKKREETKKPFEKLKKEKQKEEMVLSLMHRRSAPSWTLEQDQKIPFKFKPLPQSKFPIRKVHETQIPSYPLPQTVRGVRPVINNVSLDLGRLTPLVRDPNVSVIECNGPDEVIVVKGRMGTKPTSLSLSKEEVENVLGKISEASRIPLSEGVHKIAVGNLIVSAIISEVVGSKFIIRKMVSAPPAKLGFRRF